jgi:Polyketide cyclase / dehydrase and lipid transport
MPDLEQVTQGAKQVGKRVKDSDTLNKPVGLAVAGAAIAALPFAIEKLTGGKISEKADDVVGSAKEKVKSEVADTAKDALPDSPGDLIGGNPLKKVLGGGDDDDSDDDGDSEGRAAPGFGSGRRMPIQQSVDVAIPVKEAYNHWTQFENWPEFMHRIESAEQVDDCTVSFQAKMWGITKRFEAEIVEQRPDVRIEWNVTEEPDPARPLARRPAGERDRQGEPRDAVRQARGARGSASLQGLCRALRRAG